MGLRLSEARFMVWDESGGHSYPMVIADMTKSQLHLKATKHDGKPRIKPITGAAKEALRALYAEREPGCALVFPRKDGKQPLSFRKRIERAISDAELQDFVWHDLRHTTASYLAMMGMNGKERQEALHHRNLVSQQRYTHLSPSHETGVQRDLSSQIIERRMSPSRFLG